MSGYVALQCSLRVQLVEALDGVKRVVLSNEPVWSLTACDKVRLDTQLRGAGSDPLLHVGRGENIVDATIRGGCDHENGRSASIRGGEHSHRPRSG